MPAAAVYRPPFTLTPALLSVCAEISRLVGRVEGLPSAAPQVQLRRRNRIRTVQATLAIEGAGLDEPLVTALLEGKRVVGGRQEIREVTNAIAAYERVTELDPSRVKDLLTAHEILMGGLVPDAGRLRKGGVGVVQGTRVAHVAPPPSQVQRLVEQLLGFVAEDRETLPIIKAAVTHYELEFIHPFSDGNGRIGRLWEHRMLLDVHPVFEHVPVESVVRSRQDAYYAALGEADRSGDATPFLLFSLAAMRDALTELLAELRPEPATAATRLERARSHFAKRDFSRADYARLFPSISAPTASRDLRAGVDDGVLIREGDKATARYAFAAEPNRPKR
ncbi:MAG: Fic family protein [Polyangiaceae bacterium]